MRPIILNLRIIHTHREPKHINARAASVYSYIYIIGARVIIGGGARISAIRCAAHHQRCMLSMHIDFNVPLAQTFYINEHRIQVFDDDRVEQIDMYRPENYSKI